VRDAVPATVPVIAGTGAPSARQAAALTADAADHFKLPRERTVTVGSRIEI